MDPLEGLRLEKLESGPDGERELHDEDVRTTHATAFLAFAVTH